MKSVSLSERDIMHDLTIKIVVKRDWRVVIGLLFMRIGCALCGCGLDVEKDYYEVE